MSTFKNLEFLGSLKVPFSLVFPLQVHTGNTDANLFEIFTTKSSCILRNMLPIYSDTLFKEY